MSDPDKPDKPQVSETKAPDKPASPFDPVAAALAAPEPVTSLGQAAKNTADLGRVPPAGLPGVADVGRAPVRDNLTGGATVVPAGTPNAQLRPDLPRIGDGTARGETQPGILPPGEAERAADPERALELRERAEQAPERVQLRNGMIHVGDRAVVPVASASVAYAREGDELVATLTPLGARPIELRGAAAESLKAQLAKL